jgi:glycerol uptake facilitator-like aquaporin
MLKYYIEFFGTFLLVTALGISGDPIAIGLLLAALIYIGADLSGGHFNPAVTLAAWAADEIPASGLTGTFTSQILGALTASGFVWWLSGSTFVTQPNPSTSIAGFIAVEFVFSFLFILTFLSFVYPDRRRRNPLYGLMAGGMLGACYLFAEPYSGIGLNPALNIGFTSADTINNGYSYYHLPIYILSPLVGGLAAAYTHVKISSHR